MATRKKGTTKGQEAPTGSTARSLGIAKAGIRTGSDFANFMSALMSDLISGAVAPNIGNAACNAGGKLLKAVEMQHKYGTPDPQGGTGKVLRLAMESVQLAGSESKTETVQ